MGYLSVWKIIEEMVTDLRSAGNEIPSDTMRNLRSARTLIQILSSESSQEETIQRIEEYLNNLEIYVVSEGDKVFGKAYADRMLKRLAEGRKRPESGNDHASFLADVPRDDSWIRVKPTPELTEEALKILAGKSKLSFKSQDDGSLLIYGKASDVKVFVKKMAMEYGSTKQK